MSESLRNDGRVWVPKETGDPRRADKIPEEDRDYYLERRYPTFGNLVPRDVASRNAKMVCDEGRGVGPSKLAVYLDFTDSMNRLGVDVIKDRYGNLFDMYERITGEDPYTVPMRIYPAPHYAMGGLWVDYNLMTTIPGLFCLGEANFSDHGANRLGASALMQGLADGYFVAPYTTANYLASTPKKPITTSHPAFDEAEKEVVERMTRLLAVKGSKTVTEFHRQLGKLMWDKVGISRNESDLGQALIEIKALREEFWKDVKIVGKAEDLNRDLEHAMRVADYLEFAEMLATDAKNRRESCGSHLRDENVTEDGEALRNDQDFAYVAAWEFKGVGVEPVMHKEPLTFENVEMKQRNYK